MFAGHVGAGLAIGRMERRVNVGVFIAAALLLDFVLWLLVLLGWESVSIPANFASTHQAHFIFPYSHGLVAALAWSLLAAAVAYGGYARSAAIGGRAAVLIGMTVAPPLPSALAMAGSSVLTLVVICALAGWFGRLPPAGTVLICQTRN
jgi:hypothetical protein